LWPWLSKGVSQGTGIRARRAAPSNKSLERTPELSLCRRSTPGR
jgi:hypothetical protein